jgi:uncharacterized protein YcfJ
MKKLLLTVSLIAATASPALANKQQISAQAYVEDHYKTVLEQKPYNVEVCRDVKVPYGNRKHLDTEGAIIGGIIGGVIGNQFGKGDGKEAMTGIGALSGAIIGGSKDKGPEGYSTQRQCTIETRYKETEREVYSHSTIHFVHEGMRYVLKFQK